MSDGWRVRRANGARQKGRIVQLTQTVPLIRAANVLPLIRWIEANRLDADRYLERADLGYWFALSPFDPIPTHNGIAMLRELSRDHGPGVAAEIVNQASIAELGFIGRVALGARSPLEALHRLNAAMPMHSSHEILRLIVTDERITIHHAFAFSLDPESLHAVHVLLIAMLHQLFGFTGLRAPLFEQVDMVPHPDLGLSHLAPLFSDRLRPAEGAALTITMAANVAMNPFRVIARDRLANGNITGIAPLAEDRSLAASVRSVIAAMLHGGEPTIARIAGAGNISPRSLQRRLAEEGTSYSRQLDIVRRDLAMKHAADEGVSLADLSERLGYSAQSALTRAVRRLTGRTPSQLADRQGG